MIPAESIDSLLDKTTELEQRVATIEDNLLKLVKAVDRQGSILLKFTEILLLRHPDVAAAPGKNPE